MVYIYYYISANVFSFNDLTAAMALWRYFFWLSASQHRGPAVQCQQKSFREADNSKGMKLLLLCVNIVCIL